MNSRNTSLSGMALGLALLVPVTVSAHSFGAGGAGWIAGLAHPFLGLDHLLAMVAVGVWATQLGRRAVWQVPLAALLGVTPGCGGAVMVVAAYASGKVGFGALVAALIATEFADFQLIVVTHDERFFLCLKDQQAASTWRFARIKVLDRDFGPRLADEKITDAMITDRWDAGESAANEMRKAEEEWLLGMCREFGVNIRIRTLERAYSYDRGELAVALATFLKDAKLDVPNVPGVNNRFLTSLQTGVVENFGSHFQEGPYGDGSLGDEKARWNEFVQRL